MSKYQFCDMVFGSNTFHQWRHFNQGLVVASHEVVRHKKVQIFGNRSSAAGVGLFSVMEVAQQEGLFCEGIGVGGKLWGAGFMCEKMQMFWLLFLIYLDLWLIFQNKSNGEQ